MVLQLLLVLRSLDFDYEQGLLIVITRLLLLPDHEVGPQFGGNANLLFFLEKCLVVSRVSLLRALLAEGLDVVTKDDSYQITGLSLVVERIGLATQVLDALIQTPDEISQLFLFCSSVFLLFDFSTVFIIASYKSAGLAEVGLWME